VLSRQKEFVINHNRFKGKILDIGTQTGEFSIEASKMGFDVTAVDINLSYLKKMKELQKKNKTNVKIIHADLMNGIKGKFDTVYMGKILEHLKNPEKAVQIAINSVKKGGTLFISVPCGFAHFDPDHKNFFFPRKEYSFLLKSWLLNKSSICLEDFFDKFNQSFSVILIDWNESKFPSLDFLVIIKVKR